MKNHNLAIKLTFLAFFALAIGACFSPWQGDEGTLTLSFGDSARFIYSNDIQNYSYHITLEGPGGPKQETFNSGSITFKLEPGKWDITVKAYIEEELRAFGTKTVNVKAGKNLTETIDMFGATEVSTFDELISSVVNVAGTEKEEIIIITEDIDIILGYEFRESVNIGLDTRITLCAEKDITLTNVIFTVEDGGFLALGKEGIKGNITIDGGLDVNNIAADTLGFYASSLITVEEGGTFKMNSGIIQNNAAESSGGVYNAGIFTMNGGTIRNNKSYSGGGVNNKGSFDMNGGTISDNIALYNGGGVYNAGTFTMHKGSIINNEATGMDFGSGIEEGNGGGIYNDDDCLLELNGGKITGNTARVGGGVSSCIVLITGTDISGNTGGEFVVRERFEDPVDAEQYTVTLIPPKNGSIWFQDQDTTNTEMFATEKEIITICANPDNGYKVNVIKVQTEEGKLLKEYNNALQQGLVPWEFDMYAFNVTVYAEFMPIEIILDERIKFNIITPSGFTPEDVCDKINPINNDSSPIVSFLITPKEGFQIVQNSVIGNYDDCIQFDINFDPINYNYSFNLPKDGNVTINIQFELKRYPINVLPVYNGEVTISVNGKNYADEAQNGETVTITTSPSPGYILGEIEVSGENGEIGLTGNTFIMPASDVTVNVVFKNTPSIVSVTVKVEDDKHPQVRAGGSLKFLVDVVAQGGADDGVTWSLGGDHNPSTTIDANNGLLNVSSNETPGGEFTVTATSKGQGFDGIADTITVKVLAADTYSINLASGGNVVGGSFKVVQSDTSDEIRTTGKEQDWIWIKFTAEPGWIVDVDNIKYSDSNGSNDATEWDIGDGLYWFSMPSSDVTVSVKFIRG